MFTNRWTFAVYNMLITVSFNLVTRAIWWSDEPLFYWNVPLALVLGYIVGHLIWPAIAWSNRRHAEKITALHALHLEHMKLIEDIRIANQERNYRRAMAKIDEFLANPSTGIEIKRHKNTEVE